MTLYELSFTYEESADLLWARIHELQQQEKQTTDSHELRCIQKRLEALGPILREMRELANLSRHYYERSYHKNERYSL